MLYNFYFCVLDFVSNDISEEHDNPTGSKVPWYLLEGEWGLFIYVVDGLTAV
jgi:hypothetical protein